MAKPQAPTQNDPEAGNAPPEAQPEAQDLPAASAETTQAETSANTPAATETETATLVTARRPGRLPGEVSMNDIERIEVTAYQDRFRRAGREFGREPVGIMVDDISDTDLKVLLNEPMLNVLLIAKE